MRHVHAVDDEARRRERACGRSLPNQLMALLTALTLMVLAALAQPAHALPYLPSDDAQPLERLPTAGSKEVRELRQLHAELARSPHDLELALRVAKHDREVARAEADPRYNGYAEAALAPWINLAAPPVEVLVMRASLRQANHDFQGALTDLAQAIASDPSNAQAWLTRAVILQVQGDYVRALASCQSLRRFAENLVTAICIDSVGSLTGQARASNDNLQQMLSHAPADENVQIRLWALTVLAEAAARLGDPATAEARFNEALSLGVRDVYLLGAYADFLLDEDRPHEVQMLLKDEVRIDPLLLRLALAEQRLNAPELAGHVADLAERFAAARLRGDAIHQREEARFTLHLLKRPPDALVLAEANWAVQREPWDFRLLLETALEAHAPTAAQPALELMRSTRLEDTHLSRLAAQLVEAAP